VYAFSDWDAGLVIVDENGSITRAFATELASPVYANLLAIDSERLVVCDISGFMHNVNIESMEIKSTKIASKPIFSSPVLAGNSIIVGSHDGTLRCVDTSDFAVTLWKYDAGSVIYSSPLFMRDGKCLACTTAGDVIVIDEGKEMWRLNIPGEVWSDPSLVGNEEVVVGARDSRLHIAAVAARP
jgi:hypothetical protein